MNVSAQLYAAILFRHDIPKQRMDPARSFRDLSERELLAHAHHLCDSVQKILVEHHETGDELLWGKANRHYASLQMCLSFAGWYTLQQLMEMNKFGSAQDPGAS